MELLHDYIQQNLAGKSVIECADSSGQIQRFVFRNIT
jgi:hypothetical protein